MYYNDYKGICKVSALGMGNMRLPVTSNDEIDYEKSKEIIDYAYASGVNYYDTAYIYHNGKSEGFVGKALAEYPRDSYYLATKYNMMNPDYQSEFDEQLTKLRTDYIDFYMLHGLQNDTVDHYLNCGALEYFDSLKKKGMIRFFGVSIHCTPDKFEEVLDAYAWDFVQLQINYYDWLFGDAKQLYDLAAARDIPVMVMEPIRGGKLASLTPECDSTLRSSEPEMSVASWALRWITGLPKVAVILSGMSDMDQVRDNIKTFEIHNPLTNEQEKLLMEACKIYRPTVSVACTSCRYCCDDCPQALDIPFLLSVYNDVKLGGDWRINFLEGLPDDKRPSACVSCGVCTKLCPQGFDVPVYLQEMAAIAAKMKGNE